jgi:putative PIN family toxin of toxin-antitoxin system
MLKIVIDSNLWISFLISKKLKNLDKLCFDKNIAVVSSPKVVAEFLDVSSRKKIKKYLKQKDIPRVLNLIEAHCVDDPTEYAENPELEDPDDLYLLALSDAVKANYLLTGDKDLLLLKKYNNTEIISYSEFISKHKSFLGRIKHFLKNLFNKHSK